MKYNYPIKYTAMPVVEINGWNHGVNSLERRYDIACYIVSKCYLISDKIEYHNNGTQTKKHEVVFPYQMEDFEFKRVTPSFNIRNNNCTTSTFVEKVFNSYEEAQEFTVQKNKIFLDEKLLFISSKEEKEEQKEKFNQTLSKYKILEKQILMNTTDLDQTRIKKLDNIIKKDQSKMNISSNNLYYYLENYNFSTFVVYSIPVEEYNKLLTLINNQNPTDESISKIIESAIPILYHNKENENILVINKDGKVSSYINEWGKLENIDELEMLPIELNNSEKTEKLFTTETLEDIELSFKKYKKINLATITKQHLQKTKVKKINN